MDSFERLHAEVIECRKCLRLVLWRERVAAEKKAAFKDWDYWGRPLAGFGDARAELLVVGLAPAAHGLTSDPSTPRTVVQSFGSVTSSSRYHQTLRSERSMSLNSKSIGADLAFAWPSAEIAVMGPSGAANILYRKQISEAADPAAEQARLVGGVAELKARQEELTKALAAAKADLDKLKGPVDAK